MRVRDMTVFCSKFVEHSEVCVKRWDARESICTQDKAYFHILTMALLVTQYNCQRTW